MATSLQSRSKRYASFDVERYAAELLAIIEEVRAAPQFDGRVLRRALRQHPRDGRGFFSKSQLVIGYQALCQAGLLPFERATLYRLQMKPVRTQSGVAPVAVLTEPAGCPGRCIFCPNDPAMPKSYLALEPGAQRALRHQFDPYEQTKSRIEALQATGHPVHKVELLILGGTWSAYSAAYGRWFVQRCFDALNGHDSASLEEAQRRNERAAHRCVGLTVETRPDWVTPAEALRLRQLGVTRVQVGVQSLDDRILALNRRGHDVAAARRACRLLRAAGFKLHLHWMPNLLGATPEGDLADFGRLWQDIDLRPDELKIYPCSLLQGTELHEYWQAGEYQPYSTETLIDLLAACKAQTPLYCRLSRVVRDIPADYIVAGNRLSNLREAAQQALAASGRRCQCIRCRELRNRRADSGPPRLSVYRYDTGAGQEHFLAMETAEGRLAAFLRLLLPWSATPDTLAELAGSALIREVHVYGPAVPIGQASEGEAQHRGLGSQLIEAAADLARQAGYQRLAVIAAVGTRPYYRRHGFELGELYMARDARAGRPGELIPRRPASLPPIA